MQTPLLPELPAEEAPASQPATRPAVARIRRPVRNQVGWVARDLDSLVAEDHAVRGVWAFVERLDLTALYGGIRATADRPGRPATDPQVLLGLWVYATAQGVGSARELARLCEEHDAYRWLRGGTPVNYHLLADFRVERGEALDKLLSQIVAAMMAEGLVELEQVSQDGIRVRASAGAASFRREERLKEYLAQAEAQVAAVKEQREHGNQEVSRREQAARERAARERVERVEQALQHLPALQASKDGRSSHKAGAGQSQGKSGQGAGGQAEATAEPAPTPEMGSEEFQPSTELVSLPVVLLSADGEGAAVADGRGSGDQTPAPAAGAGQVKTKVKEARASTTDADARVMKMPDGGYRPAYNGQFATTGESRVIVGVAAITAGSDAGLAVPMVQQIERRTGKLPASYLTDGGFCTFADIEGLTTLGITVYMPVPALRKLVPGRDPYARQPGDSAEVAAWRARMGTDEAKVTYRQRAAHAEWSNAQMRGRYGLQQFPVRGVDKVLSMLLLLAVSHDLLRWIALSA